MATTIASLNITSTDLLSDTLAISTVAELTNTGSSTGVTQTTGLGRTKTESTSQYILFYGEVASFPLASQDQAAKIYIKNLSTTAAQFITIHVNAEEVGRLYAGDWCFMPWSIAADTSDVKITPSVSSALTIEHICFFES
tara:strand:+ start:71 stop:490 length:420 start_codon:yes stop_codon:yes gene_type:complete